MNFVGDFEKLKTHRSSPSEVFLAKGVLKICSKFTGERLCRSAISIKLQSNFIEVALWHKCSPVNLLHIFRNLFLRTPLNDCFWTFIFSNALRLLKVDFIKRFPEQFFDFRDLVNCYWKECTAYSLEKLQVLNQLIKTYFFHTLVVLLGIILLLATTPWH